MDDLFTFAKRRRDRGMDVAADAEDRDQPEFAELAYSAIVSIARRQPEVHVDDVLRECAARPHHPNAWGAIWMRAIRENLIERTGRVRPSADTKKNAHQYPIYRSLICRRAA